MKETTMQRADHRKFHIIYKTTCLITGRWYIGMHSTDDLNDGYLGSGQRLWKSIKKYGKEQHKCEVLEHLGTRKDLALREEEMLTLELRANPLCMNVAPGGIGHHPGWYTTSESTKEKLAEKSKVMWAKRREEGFVSPKQSIVSIAKRVAKNTGKKRTEEQLANLAAGQQAYYSMADKSILLERGQRAARTKTERGTNLGGRQRGFHVSDEQKLKQSLSTKGKIFSDEHKAALKAPKRRATCIFCRTETSVGGISRYHHGCD